MSDLNQLLEFYTDIANCTLGNLETKRKIRAAVLKIAGIAMHAQKKYNLVLN